MKILIFMTNSGQNQYEFRIFAMRRSGHHGITNWLAHLFNKDEVFWFNDIPENSPIIYSDTNLTRYTKYRKRFLNACKKPVFFNEYNYKTISKKDFVSKQKNV